jgi:2-oxoglutarate ferredoxin oxidoreductase subunit delta
VRSPVAQRFWRVPLDAESIPRVQSSIHILEERCKGCAYCVEFCPRDVFVTSKRFNLKGYHPPEIVALDRCTACHFCEILCPEFAIGVTESARAEVGHAS